MKHKDFMIILRKYVDLFEKYEELYPDMKDLDMFEGDWFEHFSAVHEQHEVE